MLLQAESILLPGAAQPVAGHLEIRGERIVEAAAGPASREPDQVLEGLVAPGFVDVHAHGGGGASFVTTDPADALTVLAAHRASGTTTMVASLVTASIRDMADQVACLAELWQDGELAGIHLEGPWLAAGRKGAHTTELLRDPDPLDVQRLLDAGRGAVRMATIAPERAGAITAIRMITDAGAVAAVGHTEADFDATVAAIDAGATGATHLFNAMPELQHRDPGPVLALLLDPRVRLEVIFDGVHLHARLAEYVLGTLPERGVLITDAISAAAAPDGDYQLGGLPVEVHARIARITGTDTLAGSTLTLGQAVRNAVAAGIPPARAIRAASQLPADYLGLTDVGRLAAGCFADLVVLDATGEIRSVMRHGAWL